MEIRLIIAVRHMPVFQNRVSLDPPKEIYNMKKQDQGFELSNFILMVVIS